MCGPKLHMGQTSEIKNMIMFRHYPCKYLMV